MNLNSIRLISGRTKNLVLLTIALLISIFIFVATDVTLGILHRYLEPEYRGPQFYTSGLIPDPDLGYRIVPDLHFTDSKYSDQTLVYTATYTTDQYGRRVVPACNTLTHDSRFIAFFGCSFTFGEGVNDEETLPNYVSQLFPEYQCYNYGVPGYGIHQILAKLQSGTLKNEIPEQEGILIYPIIPAHFLRTVGTMRILTRWGETSPYYYLDKNSQLCHDGSFIEERPDYIRLLNLIAKSGFVQFFSLDFPAIHSKDYELGAKMIIEIDRLFREQFNSLGFYLVFYPTVMERRFSIAPLKKRLSGTEVHVLNYSDYETSRKLHAVHAEYDLHPNSVLHHDVAKQIYKDISQDM